MSDEAIPDHIWEAARALRGAVTWGSNESVTIIAGFLWGVVLMERDRCAKVAERDGSAHDATLSQQTAEWQARVNAEVRAADRIASSIRFSS